MGNQTLIAVPLFVLMGVILEKSKIAERLLNAMSGLFGQFPGGLGIAVTLVGVLMAASTGIVGATVVTMGLMSLPSMLKANYNLVLPPAPFALPARSGKSSRRLLLLCCWATFSVTPISRRS